MERFGSSGFSNSSAAESSVTAVPPACSNFGLNRVLLFFRSLRQFRLGGLHLRDRGYAGIIVRLQRLKLLLPPPVCFLMASMAASLPCS